MTRTEILQTAKTIQFNDEMVRAIQNRDKTVTRRKVKPQPPKEANGIYERMDNGNFQMKVAPYESIYDYEIIPPYKVGDFLFVQETWSEDKHNYLYCTDFSDEDLEKLKNIMRWGSPECMPRKAARIFLRVTDVHVERLQDITITGLQDEGILPNGYISQYVALTTSLFDDYKVIWNSTIKKSELSQFSWNANPWVWVIEFERMEVTE